MLLNANQPRRRWIFGVYGESGVGKTHLGVTAPDPVILLGERQGFETVRDAARLLGKPVPPAFWINNPEALRVAVSTLQTSDDPLVDLIRHFAGPGDDVDAAIAALPYRKPKTVVADSATEFLQLVWEGIGAQAKTKIAADGLPEVSMRYWGVMKDRSGRLIRAFRDLPYHVLFLALLDDREVGEEDERSRIVQPLTPMRSIPSMLVAATNAFGVAKRERKVSREEGTDKRKIEIRRYVQFEAPSYVVSKPLSPLEAEEIPDVSDWFRRLELDRPDETKPEQKPEDKPEEKTSSRRRRKSKPQTEEPAASAAEG